MCVSCSGGATETYDGAETSVDARALDVMNDRSEGLDADAASDAATRDRADAGAAPRCFGVEGTEGPLRYVASIPRETWGLANGASGCVGDVDNDGRREFILLRMNEPSELIGGDLCSRGRVLLPDYARDCVIADVDGVPGNELIVMSSVGWTAESVIAVGAVAPAEGDDRTIERFVFRLRVRLDERRPVSPVGAPHVLVTDLDRDGRRELAVSGNFPSSFVRVWEQSDDRWTSTLSQSLVTVMDESHGWLRGDIDADGDDEAVLLSSCGASNRHVVRTYQRWTDRDFTDTETEAPAHGTIAELDLRPPAELVLVHRAPCQERPSTPALQVRRYDGASGRWSLLSSYDFERPAPELRYVAAIDVVDSAAPELVVCSSAAAAPSYPRACRLFAVRGDPPTIEPLPSRASPFVWTSEGRVAMLASILVDDLDEDGASELFLMGQDHVDVLRGPRR
jgi:hypothetical protein